MSDTEGTKSNFKLFASTYKCSTTGRPCCLTDISEKSKRSLSAEGEELPDCYPEGPNVAAGRHAALKHNTTLASST